MFPWRAFITSFGVFLILLSVMKWGVDVCLPAYPQSSKVFRSKSKPADAICRPLMRWDLWAREKQDRASGQLSIFDDGPGLLDTDEGKPAYILFSKDLIKLTVLLSRVPKNHTAIMQLLVFSLIMAFVTTVLVQWIETFFVRPLLPNDVQQIKNRRRVEERAHQTLIQSSDTIESSKKKGPGKPRE